MDLASGTSGNMLDRVRLTITMRDLVLMNLCLHLVVNDHAKGGSLRFDIQNLQVRLGQYQPVLEASRKKLAG